jgi:CheY-like chemotaxis protein
MAGQRVLLIEDDHVFAELLSRQFESRGIPFVHCGTGKEALDTFAKDGAFDVILLDLSLPDIDGLDILKRVRAVPALAAIPVVVISNFAVEQDIAWGKDLGIKQFVKKISVMPVDIVDIALKACESPAPQAAVQS